MVDPYYLSFIINRKEFGRYIDFKSIDSVRNRFYFNDLAKIEIPLPDIKEQKAIGSLYHVYCLRKKMNIDNYNISCDISPIIVRGSLLEAKNE